MDILFLTNNALVTRTLFCWLKSQEENVVLCENKLNSISDISNRTDFIVSYNYHHIIPLWATNLYKGRAVNLHISLLPWNRGYAPNFWSFYENTPKGVTIHNIDEGLDTGDILVQREMFFEYAKDIYETTYSKLHLKIQELFVEFWKAIKNGEIIPKKQPKGGSFHTKKQTEEVMRRLGVKYSDAVI